MTILLLLFLTTVKTDKKRKSGFGKIKFAVEIEDNVFQSRPPKPAEENLPRQSKVINSKNFTIFSLLILHM